MIRSYLPTSYNQLLLYYLLLPGTPTTTELSLLYWYKRYLAVMTVIRSDWIGADLARRHCNSAKQAAVTS